MPIMYFPSDVKYYWLSAEFFSPSHVIQILYSSYILCVQLYFMYIQDTHFLVMLVTVCYYLCYCSVLYV